MDVLTIGFSALISSLCTIAIMLAMYSRWILPTIKRYVSELPETLTPFIDSKISLVLEKVDEKVDTVSQSVKASTSRFTRSVNQAVTSLAGEDIDLETEEGQKAVQERLSANYSLPVVLEAVQQLYTSYKASKEGPKNGPKKPSW